MWARGNTSSQVSLVQYLCNSLVLVLACAATEGSGLFPSLMLSPVLVISSSFDAELLWHTKPQKHHLVVKSQGTRVQWAGQCWGRPLKKKILSNHFLRKIKKNNNNLIQSLSKENSSDSWNPPHCNKWVTCKFGGLQVSDSELAKTRIQEQC